MRAQVTRSALVRVVRLAWAFAAFGCGGDESALEDAGQDASTEDGGPLVSDGGAVRDGGALRDGAMDASEPPIACTPLTRRGVSGTIEGRPALTFTQMPRATVIPGHIRVQADDLAITLRQWVVTVPNAVGTYRCGDTDSIQVALVGVDGVVGDGGTATANATEGECTITVRTAATTSGDDVEGCFEARIVAHAGASTADFAVVDGAFLAPRQ
jgi:hypothetical protein